MPQPFASDADITLAFASAGALLPPGETGFHRQRQRAQEVVVADVALGWYRDETSRRGVDWRATPLEPGRLDPGQLRQACVLKTLELLFDAARTVASNPDGFERNASRYREEYEAELKRILGQGLRYDWDGSGRLDAGEQRPVWSQRRLVRS